VPITDNANIIQHIHNGDIDGATTVEACDDFEDVAEGEEDVAEVPEEPNAL
jgi:hypothetical protein